MASAPSPVPRPLELDAPPPVAFPPGASPFQQKGMLYVSLLDYIRDHVPGGVAGAIDKLPDALKPFYRGTFLAAGWYDFLPSLALFTVGGRIMGASTATFLKSFVEWQTFRDTHSVNRIILSAGSVDRIATRLGPTYSRYFNFGEVSTTSPGRTTAVSSVRGLPRFLFEWYRYGVDSGAAKILQVAGARDVETSISPPEADGDKSGVALIRFEITRTWKPA
jgi:hypothetical protein